MKKLKGRLWNQVKTLNGVRGVGLSDDCLIVYVKDETASGRVRKKIGMGLFLGALVRCEEAGDFVAQS